MKIRLNEAQIRTICESYIVGSPEGTINYVEIEVDDHELATDCNGYSEVIELTIDERDYYSRDLIGPTGSVSGLQYLDRREAEKDEIADMARIVQEEEDLHAADEAGQ